jgi:integrase
MSTVLSGSGEPPRTRLVPASLRNAAVRTWLGRPFGTRFDRATRTLAEWIVGGAAKKTRRTCARLCHLAGGELHQIQFLLGNASIQTTERYLGCKQKLRFAVNDTLGIEPECVA